MTATVSDHATRPVRLGLMTPLTGLVALYGPEISRAGRLACDEINAGGGVLGRPLELIVEDDGSLPETAVPAARRLVEEHGCVALIGNLLSNSRIAVASQVAEPARMPYLNFSFYEGSIGCRHFFHFAALPNQQIERMIPAMAARYGPKMYFAGSNYEWPLGSIDAAKRALLAIGGEVVGETYLPIGIDDARAIDDLLTRVARSGADVFVPYFAGADQITLLTRFYEMGLKGHMAVVMGHYDELMVSRLAPEVRAGLYSSNTYFMSVDTPENRACLARLAALPEVSGVWPDGDGVLTNFGEATWLCVKAFAQAAETAGGLDPDALVAALERVRLRAPQGEVRMDPASHHAYVNTYLARCEADGSFTIVESFGRIAPVIPDRYLANFFQARTAGEGAGPVVPSRPTGAPRVPVDRRVDHILALADAAVIAADEQGVIVQANRVAREMFGYGVDEMLGLSVHQLVPPQFRNLHVEHVRRFLASDQAELPMGRRGEVSGYRKDGSVFPAKASIARFRSGDECLLVVTLQDISERKLAEQALTWRASHDPLTALPNRALIRDRLSSALARSKRGQGQVVLLFIDLDGFKLINDSHGHEAGDRLLVEVAERLVASVRPGDTVGRLGGDEFVVLGEQVEDIDALSGLAERLNAVLREPVRLDGHDHFVSASIGVAVGHGASHSAEDMLRNADAAMYAVKARGRDGWQFFSEDLHREAARRLAIANGLRGAVERGELHALYQPIVATDSGRIRGAELLARWRPLDGEVSPAAFIPIAEMSGAIQAIGVWAFDQACAMEARLRQRWGEEAPYISVNLSTRQLDDDDLVETFSGCLRARAANPARIVLEITETALMSDVDSNLRVLRGLADLGLRVAVDDFGTGYSSLAQLLRLPVDTLKIDREFISGIDKRPDSRAITTAVVGMARALGLRRIAEGVETPAQLAELRAIGCEYAQGFLFHRPQAEADFLAAVERGEVRPIESPTPPIHFLLYVSRARRPMGETELNELRERARVLNAANNITGLLLYQDGEFMQWIEGGREAVEALHARLRTDPRHHDLRVVITGDAPRRVFPDWGLGLRDLDPRPGQPDFGPWTRRHWRLFDLAEDAQVAYALITAFGRGPAGPIATD